MINITDPVLIVITILIFVIFLIFLNSSLRTRAYIIAYLWSFIVVALACLLALITLPFVAFCVTAWKTLEASYQSMKEVPKKIDDKWNKKYG